MFAHAHKQACAAPCDCILTCACTQVRMLTSAIIAAHHVPKASGSLMRKIAPSSDGAVPDPQAEASDASTSAAAGAPGAAAAAAPAAEGAAPIAEPGATAAAGVGADGGASGAAVPPLPLQQQAEGGEAERGAEGTGVEEKAGGQEEQGVEKLRYPPLPDTLEGWARWVRLCL